MATPILSHVYFQMIIYMNGNLPTSDRKKFIKAFLSEETGTAVGRDLPNGDTMEMKRKKPELLASESILEDKDPDGFFKDLIPPKGRGIRTKISRSRGEFLLHYAGDFITGEEGFKRESESDSVFRFFFNFKGKRWCIDATLEVETGACLGRLVNHGRGNKQNCKMKVIEVLKRPYLCLFAIRDLAAGEELLYDYGIQNLPWEVNLDSNLDQNFKQDVTQKHNLDNQESIQAADFAQDLSNMNDLGLGADDISEKFDGSKANKGNECEYSMKDVDVHRTPIVVLERMSLAVAKPITAKSETEVTSTPTGTTTSAVATATTTSVSTVTTTSSTTLDTSKTLSALENLSKSPVKETGGSTLLTCLQTSASLLSGSTASAGSFSLSTSQPGVSAGTQSSSNTTPPEEFTFTLPKTTQSTSRLQSSTPGSTLLTGLQTSASLLSGSTASAGSFSLSTSQPGVSAGTQSSSNTTPPEEFTFTLPKTTQSTSRLQSSTPGSTLLTGLQTSASLLSGSTASAGSFSLSTSQPGVSAGTQSSSNTTPPEEFTFTLPKTTQSTSRLQSSTPGSTLLTGLQTSASLLSGSTASAGSFSLSTSQPGVSAGTQSSSNTTPPEEFMFTLPKTTQSTSRLQSSTPDPGYRADETSTRQKILFSGMDVNWGFLKLFDTFELVESADEADILVIPATETGYTKLPTLKLFTCLIGRQKHIVGHKWLKDSIRTGCLQKMECYIVKSVRNYGEWALEEEYQPFEYQIGGKDWVDAKEEDVRALLKKMNGIEVMSVSSETIIICADGELHTSSRCVNKEWVFQSIINGKVLGSPEKDGICRASDSDSDNESAVVGCQAFVHEKKIYVQTSGSLSNAGAKRTQKPQCCVYCNAMNTKMHRHLTTHHGHEREVAKILILPKHSRERRKAWIELASKGNFVHNKQVRQQGSGFIIPKYRPAVNNEKRQYLPCEFCKAEIVKGDLWKHHKTCVSKPEKVKSDGPVHNSRLLIPVNCSKELHENVVSKMRDDEVACFVKSDSLILEFGERRLEKMGENEQHTHQHISQRMRELGRIVIAMKEKDTSVKKLQDCLNPVKWKFLLQAVKTEAGYNSDTKRWSTPSFALKIGPSLKKCAKISRGDANDREDEVVRERMTRFLEKYVDEWEERVASPADASRQAAKYNSTNLLPLVEDVVKLSKHLETETSKVKQLKDYTKFCKYVLADVILFNRKRAGEAQRLKKEDFMKASLNPNVDETLRSSLSKFEQKLCETHLRVETRGKKRRKVAIIFTKTMKENIDILLKMHHEMGLHSKYVFAPPNTERPYRGTKVLKEVAQEAKLKHPERINSTNLRKQLGTMCQLLGLTETEQDILANFMGHDIQIHREFYRLPEKTLEVAKVTKILHLLNSGELSKMRDKDLNQLDLDIEVESDSEYDDEEDTSTEQHVQQEDQVADIGNMGNSEVVGERRKQPIRHNSGKPRYSNSDSDEMNDSGTEWQPPKKKQRLRLAVDDSDSDSESEIEDASSEAKLKLKKIYPKKGKRTPWSAIEKSVVEKDLVKCISLGRLPSKFECEEVIKKNPCLHIRSWTMVKGYVRTKLDAIKRKGEK